MKRPLCVHAGVCRGRALAHNGLLKIDAFFFLCLIAPFDPKSLWSLVFCVPFSQ